MEDYASTFYPDYYSEDIAVCPECAESVCEREGKFLLNEQYIGIEEFISAKATLCS